VGNALAFWSAVALYRFSHAGMNPHRKVRDREGALANTRDAYAPQNFPRRCKERFALTTNERNETNHLANCCRIPVVTFDSESRVTREKSAYT